MLDSGLASCTEEDTDDSRSSCITKEINHQHAQIHESITTYETQNAYIYMYKALKVEVLNPTKCLDMIHVQCTCVCLYCTMTYPNMTILTCTCTCTCANIHMYTYKCTS